MKDRAGAIGPFRCPLHPDSPRRAAFDALKLEECLKHNLSSLEAVREHMHRHHPAVMWGYEQSGLTPKENAFLAWYWEQRLN